MMGCFNLRDHKPRQEHAHPTPTVDFAAKLFKDESLPLPASLRTLASDLVQHAKFWPTTESPNPNFVFQSTEQEPTLDWSLILDGQNSNCGGGKVDKMGGENSRRTEAVQLQELLMKQWT
jgi:hypothetical protein